MVGGRGRDRRNFGLCARFAGHWNSSKDVVIARRHTLEARLQSFRYAWSGCVWVLQTQPNAQIHGVATLVVVALGWWLSLSRTDWALILLAMMVVWTAEYLNTAIEAVADLVSPEFHPLAKIAKDVAAAAVLLAAVGAVLIGLLVLGPPLWAQWQRLF